MGSISVARFDLREIEDVVDDREQRLGGRPDDADVFALVSSLKLVPRADPSCPITPSSEWDFVAHVGEELALGTAGGFGPVARSVGDVGFHQIAVRLTTSDSSNCDG